MPAHAPASVRRFRTARAITLAAALVATVGLASCGSSHSPSDRQTSTEITQRGPNVGEPSEPDAPPPPIEAKPHQAMPADTEATDCIRPLVDDPAGTANATVISAVLNGAWPDSPTIHAEVQFVGDTSLVTVSAHDTRVRVTDPNGALVATASVWITGGDETLQCNLWVRQP